MLILALFACVHVLHKTSIGNHKPVIIHQDIKPHNVATSKLKASHTITNVLCSEQHIQRSWGNVHEGTFNVREGMFNVREGMLMGEHSMFVREHSMFARDRSMFVGNVRCSWGNVPCGMFHVREGRPLGPPYLNYSCCGLVAHTALGYASCCMGNSTTPPCHKSCKPLLAYLK